MRRFVVLALLLGLMTLLQTLQAGADTAFNPLSLATFGFVLLAAYTLGQVAANLQLPKITGYIVTGLFFGPQILNIFSSAIEADLRVVNDLAIGLIALSAGAEMHLAGLKRIARSLLWIVLIKGLLILVAVVAVVLALASFLPFLAGQPIGLVLSVGMILGVLAIGTSPAATIAVINETGAKGRLADTTLGVAVAKDIVMVVLLALAIALTRTFSPDGHGFEVEILGELAKELGLSLLAGAILGFVIMGYLRYIGAELWLFIVGIVFAMTAIAHEFHLEALLVFIVAGFVVQNASSLGHDFVHLLEKVALPIYVVFFSVAGAGLDLGALQSVLLVALALVAVRLGAIYLGTRVATRLAKEPEPIRKYAWLSFVSQAGVVIGLSIIVENNLPGLGSEIRTLVMGTVAIHLLLGPVLFKLALARAGEIPSAAEDEAPPALDEEEDTETDVRELPQELEAPVAALQEVVLRSLGELGGVAEEGPIDLAARVKGWPVVSRDDNEDLVSKFSSRDLNIAIDRFWSDVHQASLAAPRQVSVPLEERWFENHRWDTTSERWMKRLRRARRALRRLSGQEGVLYRMAPVRSLALYHIDNALVEDLEPALSRLAAQPALVLQDGWREHRNGSRAEATDGTDPGAGWAVGRGQAIEEVSTIVEKRFRQLRKELAVVGTMELPDRKRRPSSLHERSQRAHARTTEAVDAWAEFASGVVQHERRRDAIGELRTWLASGATRFREELEASIAQVLVEPIDRAGAVLRQAAERVADVRKADPAVVEETLLTTSDALSLGLRREALAGLRRAAETRPLDRVHRSFDDHVEDHLRELPKAFRVADPDTLPDPARSVRTYPEPADHQFQLIATGAVERTLRPTLVHLQEQWAAANAAAIKAIHSIRETLELRLDKAVDAAIEEGRGRASLASGSRRESVELAAAALKRAISEVDETRSEVDGIIAAGLESFQEDFDALNERLQNQLASAKALEARIQAERARVELHGSELFRSFIEGVRQQVTTLMARFGFRWDPRKKERGEKEAPAQLRPGGRAGSNRAVLFHIMFDQSTLAGKVFDGGLIITILASILVLMMESVVPIRAQHGTALSILEWFFTLLFTLEYIARLWAVDKPSRYALSFFGLIDLLAVVPTYLSLIVPGGQFLMVIRVLRVARAFRVLKLARYVGEAQILMDALRASRYKITVFLVSVVSTAVVVGSAMYLIEGPDSGFTSIPRGVYWSIVTLTTVGFGDITPATLLGQTLAAVLMLLGYGIIAVPTGIVTAEIASRPSGATAERKCPQCGHLEGSDAAAYCPICGGPLPGESAPR